LSHLHFIFYGNNSSTSVASKFVIEANYKAEQKSPSRNNLLSFNDSSFIKFFYNFCEKNKKVINIILRRYPKKFPNELIIKISSILDLENKKKYFKQELRKLPFKNEYLRLKVRRNGSELFTDSFGSLSHKKPEQWRSKFMVTFEGEEAVDAGGVRREWLTILAKEMFNPNYMLFTLAKNGTTYTINSDSGKYNPEHLKHFEFVGKIMAKAIFDGMMLDCYFTRIIYKLITNTPLSYHDMEDYDPVFYNSLKWLLDNDFTDSDTYLTYSYNHDNLGDMQIVDLIENGRNIDVTEKNKFDYVQKLCSSKLYETIKPQVEALLKGFYEIIPQKLISIFNYRELELVISGLPTIDIKDWKNNTEYENYNTESPVIKNFWEIIESFDNDERAEFLQFVTGCSKVPLEGFSALQGIGGINKFKITKVFDKNFERLPTAHTCTNQLDLPEYPNKEILYERLTFAIKEGKGFGFI
jgi:E3 ubiquitin-protein ligase HUWE1